MSQSHYSVTDTVRAASILLDRAVTRIRNRGMTRECAAQIAADATGLKPSRVKSFLYGEAFKVAHGEYDRVRSGYAKILREELRIAEQNIELMKAELAELE